MKKRSGIFVAIFTTLALIFGFFVYEQWNSIEAFILSFSTTEEDTEIELEKNKEALQQFVDENEDVNVRDLTAEESAALASGELSEEEVVKLLTGKDEPESTATPAPEKVNTPKKKTPAKATPTPAPTPEPVQDSMSELIAKLYVQKSTYLNKLDAIEAQVRAEFLSQPKKWESKKQAKKELLAKYLPMVASWEKECDSMVYGVIDEIRNQLKDSGKDMSLADTLKQSYLEEKKLKKTYFINRYMD